MLLPPPGTDKVGSNLVAFPNERMLEANDFTRSEVDDMSATANLDSGRWDPPKECCHPSMPENVQIH
jgi:hypothetical protein